MKTLTPDTSPAALLLAILFPEDTTNGTDGDDWSAAGLEIAVQRLLNRIEKNKLDIAATLAALNALVVVNADDDAAILSAANAIANHIANTTDAHDASAISTAIIAGLTGANVQAVLAELRSQISAIEGLNAGARLTALETRAAQTFAISVADNPGSSGGSNYGDSANATTPLGSFVVPAVFWGKKVLVQVSSVHVKSMTFGNAHLYVRQSGVSGPYPSTSFVEIAQYAPQAASLVGAFSGARIMDLPNNAHDLHLEFTDTNVGGVGDLDPQAVFVTLLEL